MVEPLAEERKAGLGRGLGVKSKVGPLMPNRIRRPRLQRNSFSCTAARHPFFVIALVLRLPTYLPETISRPRNARRLDTLGAYRGSRWGQISNSGKPNRPTTRCPRQMCFCFRLESHSLKSTDQQQAKLPATTIRINAKIIESRAAKPPPRAFVGIPPQKRRSFVFSFVIMVTSSARMAPDEDESPKSAAAPAETDNAM